MIGFACDRVSRANVFTRRGFRAITGIPASGREMAFP